MFLICPATGVSIKCIVPQFGSVCVSTAFSTALEWTGLFTCRYSCAASTAVTPEKLFHSASLHQALAGSAPRLSMRGTYVFPQQTTKQPFFGCQKKVCSFKTVAFDPSLAVLI